MNKIVKRLILVFFWLLIDALFILDLALPSMKLNMDSHHVADVNALLFWSQDAPLIGLVFLAGMASYPALNGIHAAAAILQKLTTFFEENFLFSPYLQASLIVRSLALFGVWCWLDKGFDYASDRIADFEKAYSSILTYNVFKYLDMYLGINLLLLLWFGTLVLLSIFAVLLFKLIVDIVERKRNKAQSVLTSGSWDKVQKP